MRARNFTAIFVVALCALSGNAMAQDAGAAATSADTPASVPSPPDPETQQQADKLKEAMAALQTHDPKRTIRLANEVIVYYEAKYKDPGTTYYSASSPAESLMYLMSLVADAKKSGQKNPKAVVTAYEWAAAHFMKGYAYVELEDFGNARRSLQKAIDLAPANAQFQIEMGQTYLMTRNWDEAMTWFKRAEGSVAFASDEQARNFQTVHALRGQAFILIEQRKLDEAEALLNRCKKILPDDPRTDQELELIRKSR